jgi:hypothetical protein
VQLDSILEAVCAQFEAVVTIEKLAVSRVRQVTATITKIKGTVARDCFIYLSRFADPGFKQNAFRLQKGLQPSRENIQLLQD